MRLLARSRVPRLRGTAHALRSAYNGFTLVEPFPNGKLYFKRVVDRPVCVYVVEDELFILSAVPRAFAMVPHGNGSFHLAHESCVLSPGEYLDGDTCVPDAGWSEAKAWESFQLGPPPELDRGDLAAIAQIDRHLGERCKPASTGKSGGFGRIATAVSRVAPARSAMPSAPAVAERFNGSIDRCESLRAAGWSACGLHPAAVTIYVNGMRIGVARPAGERPDVAAAGYARYSAWSFAFPRPIAADDRVAFRFPDGSPIPAGDPRTKRGGTGGAVQRALMVPV